MHLNHKQFLAAASAARVQVQKPVIDEQCPLCLKSGLTSVRAFTAHVGRHMEGIALTSLPRNDESDPEADDESQSTRSQPRLNARAPSVPIVPRSESSRRSSSPMISPVSPNDLRTDSDEEPPPGIEGKLPHSPQASPFEVEGPPEEQCPHPDCGRVFKNLDAHMLTHQPEGLFDGPLKCPVSACEFHIKGFTRQRDQIWHTLTHYKGTIVCYFCPGAGSAAGKSFSRPDVFKRHLSSVHGVERRLLKSRRQISTTSTSLTDYRGRSFSNCSTCSAAFTNSQAFYEHLDLCVLRAVLATEAVDSEAKVELERSVEMMILQYTPTSAPEKYDHRHLDSKDQNPATTKDELNFATTPQEHPSKYSTSQPLQDTAQAALADVSGDVVDKGPETILKARGNSNSPKHVMFELLMDEAQNGRLPMRVLINTQDRTDSIVATVKDFYGISENRGVSFEDSKGNLLVPSYENFEDSMVVVVRTAAVDGSNATEAPGAHSGRNCWAVGSSPWAGPDRLS
jgi:hypothetical protein